ncbi:NAD-dependent epimerase/dehydratase family protein [Parafilimonas sp.]|uniref:NAD-dependent epimerase/dehydratase family protein n=1 Tax=Parafilimonas sp. TaxID=1969739 RepID=UPI0039E48BF8
MKILVTGATGFIGNYVMNELLKHDVEIIATSSNEEKAKQQAWFEDVRYIPFNFNQFDPLINYFLYFNRPDIIIHLAWEGLPNYKSSFHTEINLPGHKALLENLIRHGLKSVAVTGTCLEYGMQEGCLSEDMQTYPSSCYAIAKDELRKYLEELQQQYSFSLKWVRLFYMFGKWQSPNSLLSQLDKALQNGDTVFNMSGGEQTRDYLPVTTVAEIIVKLALQRRVEGIINCCSGKPVSVKDFVENYLHEIGKTIKLNLGYYPYTDYEPMHFWGSTKKLNKALTEK